MKFLLSIIILFTFEVTLSGQVVFENDFITLSQGSNLRFLTEFDGKLVFYADDGIHGVEPHLYDPSINKSYLLADINQGPEDSSIADFIQIGDVLYFLGWSSESQSIYELPAGSTQPSELDLGAEIHNIFNFINFNNKIFFSGNEDQSYFNQLYCYDPVSKETRKITNISSDISSDGLTPYRFGIHDNQLYINGYRANNVSSLIKYNPETDSITLVQTQLHNGDTRVFIDYMVSNGQNLTMMMRDPESLNQSYFAHYDEEKDSIVINYEAESHITPNNGKPLTIINEIIYFHQRTDSGSKIKSYNIESNEINDLNIISNSRILLSQNLDEKLFFITLDIFPWEYKAGVYDPNTSQVEFYPLIGETLHDILPGIHNGLDRVVKIDNKLYFRGNYPDDEDELLSFDLNTEELSLATNIHKGTAGNVFTILGNTENDIIIRMSDGGNNRFWNSYNTKSKELTPLFSNFNLQHAQHCYQFPGYTIATQALVNDTIYHLLVYDSLNNEFIAIEEYTPNKCQSDFDPNIQPYILGESLYFTYCDGDNWQLGLYNLNTDEFSIIPGGAGYQLASPTANKSFTMANIGNGLIFSTDPENSFYQYGLAYYDGSAISQIDVGGKALRSNEIYQTTNALYVLAGKAFSTDTIYFAPKTTPVEFSPLYFEEEPILSNGYSFCYIDSTTYFIYDRFVLSHNGIDSNCTVVYQFPETITDISLGFIESFGDKIYVLAAEEMYGLELYQLDIITPAQPSLKRLTDINKGTTSTPIIDMIQHYGKIYFLPRYFYYGYELWSYNPDECLSFSLSTQASAINQATGSISIDSINGVEPYTYEWSNGDTLSSLTDIYSGFYSVTITDANGCEAYDEIWVENNGVITSLKELDDNDYEVLIYPNPTSDIINYIFNSVPNKVNSLKLFSLNGVMVKSYTVTHTYGTINISEVGSGIYFAQFETEKGQKIIKKIIKQ